MPQMQAATQAATQALRQEPSDYAFGIGDQSFDIIVRANVQLLVGIKRFARPRAFGFAQRFPRSRPTDADSHCRGVGPQSSS